MFISPTDTIQGVIQAPPDKSISHRSLILNALAQGTATISNLLEAEDVGSTITVLRSLGVQIVGNQGEYTLESRGLLEPQIPLDCGNSGTTMRLMAGVLAAQPFHSILIGDQSLSTRPMKRVIAPLATLGVSIHAREVNRFAPISIFGKQSQHFTYQLPIPSAQVKSAMILYGLQNQGCIITGGGRSRDHTERMLTAMGAEIELKNDAIHVQPRSLQSIDITIPGDPSSAAFFVAAALIIPNAKICIQSVGINPTRIGFFDALRKMGANIEYQNLRTFGSEPVADIVVQQTSLKGIHIQAHEIPSLIDELPLLAVVAVFASGTTKVEGAEELRVKESDRISAIVHNLKMMKAEITEYKDGFSIQGTQYLKGQRVPSFGDHRIAMASAIAGLSAQGPTVIDNSDCIAISFPDFVQKLQQLNVECTAKHVKK